MAGIGAASTRICAIAMLIIVGMDEPPSPDYSALFWFVLLSLTAIGMALMIFMLMSLYLDLVLSRAIFQ